MTDEQGTDRSGRVVLQRSLGPWPAMPWALNGYPTYLGQPMCVTWEDLDGAVPDVAVIGVPWDGSTGAPPGARHGPMAIRIAEYTGDRGGDWTHPVSRVNPLAVLGVVDFGDVPVVHGAIEESFERIRHVTSEVLSRNVFPVMLGGDHAITWPHVQALNDAVDGTVGVVHFDAHCDTWPMDPWEYSSHGAPMRQLIEGGTVRGENFVQVGLRSSTDAETLGYMRDHGMRSHWMDEIRRDGLDTVLDRAVEEAMDGPDHLWLSVDIDVCDPAFAPGTGAPEPGGLTSGELLASIRKIMTVPQIRGMDLVEVSPPYDSGTDITAVLAHRVVLEALTGLADRKLTKEADGGSDG